MDKTPLSDNEFIKKYEAYEKESVEDFIRRYSSTEKELRDTIEYLIRHREMMRDVEIKKLESDAQGSGANFYDSTVLSERVLGTNSLVSLNPSGRTR